MHPQLPVPSLGLLPNTRNVIVLLRPARINVGLQPAKTDEDFTGDICYQEDTTREYVENGVLRSHLDAFVFLLRSNATPGKVSPWHFASAHCVRPPAD